MYQQLISYGESDVYPFHMPGHKRRALPFPNPYTIDITEIDGFDNLHYAEGLIREAEERAAKLYGADRSYYLVNGSTCGLLAAICAAARRGGTATKRSIMRFPCRDFRWSFSIRRSRGEICRDRLPRRRWRRR